MKFEKFEEVINAIKSIDDFIGDAQKIGVDMIDSVLYDATARIYRNLFEEVYGEEGYEWIEWAIYELPNLSNKCPDDTHAIDSDGKPIDLSTSKKLWDYLETNYKK